MPQIKYQALQNPSRTLKALIQVAVLVAASVVPLLLSQNADAAQVTLRKITLSSSVAGASTTHAVSFRPAGTTNILGIVIDYCTSPLVGTACTQPTGLVTQADAATINVTHNSQTDVPFTIHANSDQTGRVIITHATGLTSVVTTDEVEFSLTVTNPTAVCGGGAADECTFYARLLTYDSVAGAAAYAPATPGTHSDDGGVAMSTANQLTISARVQEVLHFCVGTTDGGTDCAGMSGTSVDLGVVDSSAINISPVATGSGGNNVNGLALVRTNANSGVTIGYFAVQDTSSGKLKVAGASCSGVSTTDQCFNSAISGGFSIDVVAGTEAYGMTISSVDTTNSATPTANLTRNAAYDGDAVENAEGCTASDAGTDEDCWLWDDSGSYDQIASSSTVVDDEMLVLRFAATAAATTPTGSYAVTSTFIATATF